jgi:hypothetical protein
MNIFDEFSNILCGHLYGYIDLDRAVKYGMQQQLDLMKREEEKNKSNYILDQFNWYHC